MDFLGVTVGIGLLVHLGKQFVLADADLFIGQILLLLGTRDLGLHFLLIEHLLLLLFLDAVGGIGLGLACVGLLLQVGAADGQLILALGDSGLRLHGGIVGEFLVLGPGLGDVFLSLCLGDGGILADGPRVVGTQVLNQA